jgi:hypothetical protein
MIKNAGYKKTARQGAHKALVSFKIKREQKNVPAYNIFKSKENGTKVLRPIIF